MGISVFPTPDTDAHAAAAGSRRPCAACVTDLGTCEDGGNGSVVVENKIEDNILLVNKKKNIIF